MARKKRAKQSDTQTLQQVQTELAKTTEQWKRALADYQNLQKRTEQEKISFARFASEGLIQRLLPALDTLEMAAQHIQDKGLTMAVHALYQVLQEEGLTQITTDGKLFDPHEMECIETVQAEQNDVVVRQVRSGYKLHDRVIRPAQVVVGKRF